jgi:hypothetical protein
MSDDDYDPFGTDPEYLHRADSPWTSVWAAHSVDTGKYERLVYDEICRYGRHGCIPDDIIKTYRHLPYSTLTARPSALERKGLIVRGPDTRPGKSGNQQKVMRKSRYADMLLRPKPEDAEDL